jgi:hypothetical protein
LSDVRELDRSISLHEIRRAVLQLTGEFMTNKSLVFLIAFTGLLAATYLMANTCTPRADWVTISLPDPPAPFSDPFVVTVAALSSVSELALVSSPIPEHLHVDY